MVNCWKQKRITGQNMGPKRDGKIRRNAGTDGGYKNKKSNIKNQNAK